MNEAPSNKSSPMNLICFFIACSLSSGALAQELPPWERGSPTAELPGSDLPPAAPVGETAETQTAAARELVTQELTQADAIVSKADCRGTANDQWISAAVIDSVAVALAFLSFWLLSIRDWLSPAARLLIGLNTFGICAALAIGLYEPNTITIERCLQYPDFVSELLFPRMVAWQRGAVLGFAPVLLIGLLLKLVHGFVRR